MALGKKTGGRAKGSPNRTTAETKELLVRFLSIAIEDLPEIYDSLPAFEKLRAILALSKILIPANIVLESDNAIYAGGQFSIDKIEIIHTSNKTD